MQAEIIKEAKDFYDKLVVKSRKLDAENDLILDKKNKLDSLLSKNKILKENLDVREKNILEFENVEEVRKQISKDLQELTVAQKAFNRSTKGI